MDTVHVQDILELSVISYPQTVRSSGHIFAIPVLCYVFFLVIIYYHESFFLVDTFVYIHLLQYYGRTLNWLQIHMYESSIQNTRIVFE